LKTHLMKKKRITGKNKNESKTKTPKRKQENVEQEITAMKHEVQRITRKGHKEGGGQGRQGGK